MGPALPFQLASRVVIMTTCDAASGGTAGIVAIFDRDIMRAYGIGIREMICHILVIRCCQQSSV